MSKGRSCSDFVADRFAHRTYSATTERRPPKRFACYGGLRSVAAEGGSVATAGVGRNFY